MSFLLTTDTCQNQLNYKLSIVSLCRNKLDSFQGKNIEICYKDTGLYKFYYMYESALTFDTSEWTGRFSKYVNPCPPVANFGADRQAICTGDCVQFTDKSTRLPISWQWEFEGGTPATYMGKSPPPTRASISEERTVLVCLLISGICRKSTRICI